MLFLNSNPQDEILKDKHMSWKAQDLRLADERSLNRLISVKKEEACDD